MLWEYIDCFVSLHFAVGVVEVDVLGWFLFGLSRDMCELFSSFCEVNSARFDSARVYVCLVVYVHVRLRVEHARY